MPRRRVCPECGRTVSVPDGDSPRCLRCRATIRPQEYDEPARGLPGGAIAAIVLGGIVLLVGVVVVVVLLGRALPEGDVPEGDRPPQGPRLVRTIQVANRNVWGVAFGSDGTRLVTGDGYFGPPGQVRLWQTTGEPLGVLLDPQADIFGTAVGPGDHFAASASPKGVHLIDLAAKQVLAHREHPSAARGVAFAPNGEYLASSCELAVRVWNLPGAEQRWSQPLSGAMRNWRIATRLAVAPDSRTVAVGNGNDVNVYAAADGKLIATGKGHAQPVLAVAYSPSGDLLVTGSMDRTIRLWRAGTGQPVRTVAECPDWLFCVAFAPSGNAIAAACRNGTIGLWDMQGKHLATVKAHGREANNVAFSPDGTTLASSGIDGTVCLWDVAAWAKP